MTNTIYTKISPRLLLLIYLIIPACLLVYLADLFFFNSSLKASLPRSPEYFFLVQIFLGAPHIIASNVILVTNQDYWSLYKSRVLIACVLVGLFFALGNYFLPYNVIFFLVATWTIIHVVKQQLGVGNGFYRLSKRLYQLWSSAIILLGIVIYNIVFLEKSFSEYTLSVLKSLNWFLVIAVIILTLIAYPRAKSGTGKVFLLANTVMILSSFWMFSERFFFFTILIPRFIHDVTAFVFYAVHDHNKHSIEPRNFMFKFGQTVKIPALILAPVTAVLLTIFLKKGFDPVVSNLAIAFFDNHALTNTSFFIIGFLSMIHYYTESFTWQNNSPYRQFIKFSS